MKEVDELIQLPRLTRAIAVCEKLEECGEQLGCEELRSAASSALVSLRPRIQSRARNRRCASCDECTDPDSAIQASQSKEVSSS